MGGGYVGMGFLQQEATETILSQLLLSAVGAEDVATICDKALANERTLAGSTDEAVVVPVAVLKGNETCAANTCNGAGTCSTPLGKQFTEAVSTVRSIIT